MRQILPVAGPTEIRQHARRLVRRHPRNLLIALLLHVLAAVSGLAAPRLIGDLVEDVQHGTTAAKVNEVIVVIAVFIVAQSLLTRWARYRSFALGEQVLAELREEFVDNALALPIGTVERAGTGDLLSRTSRDVDTLSRTVRFAVPETIIAFVTVIFTAIATVLVGVWVLVPLVAMVPMLWLSTKWYLRRAKDGYLRENAAYAQMTSSLAETVEERGPSRPCGGTTIACDAATWTSAGRIWPSGTRCSCGRCTSRSPSWATWCRSWARCCSVAGCT